MQIEQQSLEPADEHLWRRSLFCPHGVISNIYSKLRLVFLSEALLMVKKPTKSNLMAHGLHIYVQGWWGFVRGCLLLWLGWHREGGTLSPIVFRSPFSIICFPLVSRHWHCHITKHFYMHLLCISNCPVQCMVCIAMPQNGFIPFYLCNQTRIYIDFWQESCIVWWENGVGISVGLNSELTVWWMTASLP